MQVCDKEQLFVELTNEEESNITGGAVPFLLMAAIRLVVATGQIALLGTALMRFSGWLGSSGNGLIIGDRKGSTRDLRRAGDVPADLPHGWNWGFRSRGTWVAGGYNGPKA